VSGLARYFEKAVYETGNLKLNKGDDNFGITFACLDLKNPEKIKYRYRILGYHNDWIETDHLHRQVNIAGLNPDTYTFEVQSTDIFGDWNNTLNVQIRIPPHFHQTAAFSVSIVLLCLAIIVLFVIINNRQIRIKENQKQQYLKLESIRGQMNPHFIFNSLNSINYFIANHDRLAANRYISNFSKLIRSFLSNMSQEYIGLSDEIASLEDYLKLEFLRFGDKFNYTISFDQIQSPETWEVFPGMVQPFVENAIWHGVRGLQDRKGLINVIFFERGGIHCIITDDGVGRQLASKSVHYQEKKKSRGIGLIRERMQLINHLENKNYAIIIEDMYSDREECGTKIQIGIPSRMKQKQ
ncbi:MAG TPA: histidine kinase, partial [Bacteroidales bacterium]|nr:histidine kinase [Bacteroidales bacterium]